MVGENGMGLINGERRVNMCVNDERAAPCGHMELPEDNVCICPT